MATISAYDSEAKKDNIEKWFCNALVTNAFKVHVGVPGNAFALDDHNFQSTKSLPLCIKETYIAQKDPDEYTVMKKTKPHNVVITEGLAENIAARHVVVDHFDTCGSWIVHRHTIKHRMMSGMYANKAIVRVTISMRGNNMSEAKLIGTILRDTKRYSRSSSYDVFLLNLQELCDGNKDLMHNIKHIDPKSHFYKYGSPHDPTNKSVMINFYMLLKKKTANKGSRELKNLTQWGWWRID